MSPSVSALLAPRPDVTTDIAARAVDATKTYGRGDTTDQALDHVSAEFPRGRFTAIMGPSGSGKSTLMHCVAGLDTLTAGQVFIGDVDLSGLSEKQLTRLRRDRIGFIFQAFNLVPTLTAAENITLPMDLAGSKPDQAWFDSVISTADSKLKTLIDDAFITPNTPKIQALKTGPQKDLLKGIRFILPSWIAILRCFPKYRLRSKGR